MINDCSLLLTEWQSSFQLYLWYWDIGMSWNVPFASHDGSVWRHVGCGYLSDGVLSPADGCIVWN